MCFVVALTLVSFFTGAAALSSGNVPLAIVAGIAFVIFVVICIEWFSSDDAEHEVDDCQKPKKRRWECHTLAPDTQWFSPAPIAQGEQVVVQLSGTYSYTDQCSDKVRYADGHYYWKSGSEPGKYKRFEFLFFDDHTAPTTPFREERHLHEYRFLYEGTGKPMAVFIRRPPNYDDYSALLPRLTITLTSLTDDDEAFIRAHSAAQAEQEAERARQLQEEADARAREEAEALEAERHDRFRTIEARYGDQLFGWRNDEAVLTRYAREHRIALLNRKDEISDDYDAFHTEDLDFAEWLRVEHHELYQRIDAVFYFRVRVLAESLPEDGTTEKPRTPLTPEEKAERIRRFREREVAWERTKIDDATAMAFVAFESIEELLDAREAKIQEINAREDLDEAGKDERIRGIRAVTEHRLETLLGGSSNDTSQSPESAPVVLGE